MTRIPGTVSMNREAMSARVRDEKPSWIMWSNKTEPVTARCAEASRIRNRLEP